MQINADLPAQRARAQRGKADGNARLRNQRKPQIIAYLARLAHHRAAQKRARVFAHDAHDEIQYAHREQRHAARGIRGAHQRIQLEAQAGAHEEQKQNRRVEIIQLPEQI